jgi:hypothetical protein
MPAPARARALLLGTVLGLALAACGSASGDGAACGPARRERADPASALHLLPGAPEPEYLSDPPTSGPHQSAGLPSGALLDPLSRPVQVGLLERGAVVVQHAGLDPADVDRLEALAGPQVVVAPAEDLPAPIVATAWTWRMSCDEVDVAAIQDFAADRAREAPGGHAAAAG